MKRILSLCLINEKQLITSKDKNLGIIDMDNYSIVKDFSSGHNNYIFGIEKIKIPEKGEYLITYYDKSIKIWKTKLKLLRNYATKDFKSSEEWGHVLREE